MIFVMMGACGCGKTTLGAALAERLDAPFIEGDDYHPASNRAKMMDGTPLSDDDRWPWLDLLGKEVRARKNTNSTVVLACSSLKRAYRDRLRLADADMVFVLLSGSKDLLRSRLEARQDHFMPASLLESQLQTLESPSADERALVVDVALTPAQLLDQIIEATAEAKTQVSACRS